MNPDVGRCMLNELIQSRHVKCVYSCGADQVSSKDAWEMKVKIEGLIWSAKASSKDKANEAVAEMA